MSTFELMESRRSGLAIPAMAGGFAARLAGILRAIRRRHEARVTARQLASLSDWQLKDIGMHRNQILYRTGAVPDASSWCGHGDH